MSRARKQNKVCGDVFGWIFVLLLVLGIWALALSSKFQYLTFMSRVESGRYVAVNVILIDAWEETDHSRYVTDRYTACYGRFYWYDDEGNSYYTDEYMVDMYYTGSDHEALEPGDTVTVYYDSEDPSELVVNEQLYDGKHVGGYIFCTALTIVFLVAFIKAKTM